jgi:hypothetical protein
MRFLALHFLYLKAMLFIINTECVLPHGKLILSHNGQIFVAVGRPTTFLNDENHELGLRSL